MRKKFLLDYPTVSEEFNISLNSEKRFQIHHQYAGFTKHTSQTDSADWIEVHFTVIKAFISTLRIIKTSN